LLPEKTANSTYNNKKQTSPITNNNNNNLVLPDWNDFIQQEPGINATNPNTAQIIAQGTGNIFTTGLMDATLFMFNFDTKALFDVRYSAVGSGDFTICRLQGYLNHCKHPFIQYGGNPSNTDALHPTMIDFAIDDVVPTQIVYT
jgi:hypothetical protein